MSTLGPNIGSKHDFNDREGEHENSCTFYKRDRGETNVDAVTHRSFAEIMQEEYAYIFMDNKWYFIDCYKNETVVLLTEEICKQE